MGTSTSPSTPAAPARPPPAGRGGARIDRLAGPSEEQFLRLDCIGNFNSMIAAELQGRVTEPELRRALDRVQAHHPMLGVRALPDGDGLRLTSSGVGPIPLRVIELPVEAWIAEAEREMATNLPEAGPLIRCVLIRHATDHGRLLLTFNHGIADGQSNLIVVRDVVRLLGDEQAALPDRGEPSGSPIERHVPAGHGWGKLVGSTLRQVARWIRIGKPALLGPDRVPDPGTRGRHLMVHELAPAELARLLTACKRERTTVTGALGAALLVALREEQRRARSVILTFDARRMLEPPVGPDEVGLFAGVAVSTQRIDDRARLWPLAREVRADLREAIARREPLASLKMVGLFLSRLRKLARKGARGTAEIEAMYDRASLGTALLGNLGVVAPLPPSRQVALRSLASFVTPLGRVALYSVAVTYGDRLAWTFIGRTPLLRPERAERLAARALEILRAGIADPGAEPAAAGAAV